jgi:hypothetical protein
MIITIRSHCFFYFLWDDEAKQQIGLNVRFLVVELIHSDLNSRFDMGVAFMINYSFSER